MSISLGGLSTQVAAKLPLSGGTITGSLSSNSAITAATIGNAASVLYGNAAALSGIVAAGPTISTVTITNSGGTVIDDTAVSTTGGSYIKIVGSGFGAGAVVLIGTTVATSTTVQSSTQVLAQLGASTSGTKDVFIVNTDGTAAVKPLAITYSPFPAWSTSATLTPVAKLLAFSQTLSAPSDSTVTYTLDTGSSLPIGTALAESGVLSGAITETSTSDTTYSFTVQATDAENQNIPRTFSLSAGGFLTRKVVASDKATNDIYGSSVAFSGDGTRVVVGASRNSPDGMVQAGAAYIYIRSGSSWTLEQKIVASDKVTSDNFGFSVAFSRDGNRVVVGAGQHAAAAGVRSGAVYIFTRNNTTWTQEAKISPNSKVAGDNFGYSVAVSSDGSRVVGGAPFNDGNATDSGWAFIFVRSGTTWTQEQVIVPSVRVLSAFFGRSVSLSSDGSRVFIGASGSSAGSVYMYNRSGSVWSQEIKLDGETGGSSFGQSVSLSGDGNRVVVGAENEGAGYSGAAYVYIWNGTAWTLEQKIVPSDIQGNDKFGSSVSFSEDGTRAVVGAYLSDPGGTNGAGAAYVFTRSGTTWTQEAKIFAADKTSTGGYADRFGSSVSFSDDGSRVVVGAPYSSHGGTAQAGAAYVFSRSGTTWSPFPPLFEFTSHTFTTAGITGKDGPSIAQLRAVYDTTWELEYLSMSTNGIQRFVVPRDGVYRITAKGGNGGSSVPYSSYAANRGGYGMAVRSDFSLLIGSTIEILVGQNGLVATQYAGSGAGGSYVVSSGTLLLAAGGGGGGGHNTNVGKDGLSGTSGDAGSGTAQPSAGGTNGGGGGGAYACGGAGWSANGNLPTMPPYAAGNNMGTASQRFVAGGSGGTAGGWGYNGGFGGGGHGYLGGGGGGGYSGGGSGGWGNWGGAGGGGGSYSSTTMTVLGASDAVGYVTIEFLG